MLEERINTVFNELSETDFRILNYLLAHKQKLQEMTIQEISKEAYVSSASIVRLAKKLSFSGFSELRFALKEEEDSNSKNFESSISLLESDIHDTLNLITEYNLQPVCENIHKANRIFCFGTDWGETTAAQFLTRSFLACNVYIYLIPSITEFFWILENIDENDLIFILSFSGNNKNFNNILPNLKAKGVPIVSITPLSRNYLSSEATYRLYYKATFLDHVNSKNHEYNFYPSLNVLIDFLFRYYYDNYYIN